MKNQEKVKTESMRGMPVTFAELGISAPEKRATQHQFAVWIRSLLQNWRQGTVGVKDRSEVALSGKKPWKQKGTGRARAGTAGSPLWRGGGVSFGPQPRTRTLQTSKQSKQQVLMTMLADAIERKRLVMADWELPGDQPKTAQAAQLLAQLGLDNKKVILFLKPSDMLSYTSFMNISSVRVLYFDQPNAYDLANGTAWVFLKKDADAFKEMVARWQ